VRKYQRCEWRSRWDSWRASSIASQRKRSNSSKRRELGNELNFIDAVNELRIVRDVLIALDKEDASVLPAMCKGEVGAAVEELRSIEREISEFTVATTPDPVNRRNDLASRTRLAKDKILMWRGQIRSDAIALRSLREDAEAALIAARAAGEEWVPLAKEIRTRLGEVGASELSSKYRSQAKEHKEAAGRYGLAAIIATAATIALAAVLFINLRVPSALTGTNAWVQLTRDLVARVFFLGLASYVVTFLARNYRVNKHLQVANEQKSNALDTFPLFSASALSSDARDVIIAELVKTVFSPADTGYLGGDTDTTIVESGASLVGMLASRASNSS
jgi:hypothetical protein